MWNTFTKDSLEYIVFDMVKIYISTCIFKILGCSIKGGQLLKIDNAENKNLNGCVGEGGYFKIHKRKKCAVFKCNLKGKNKWKTEKLKNYGM